MFPELPVIKCFVIIFRLKNRRKTANKMICVMPAVAMPEVHVGAAVKTGKLSYRNDTIYKSLFLHS